MSWALRCESCKDPNEVCDVHCDECGIAWQPGFYRILASDEAGEEGLVMLLCPTCFDHAFVS